MTYIYRGCARFYTYILKVCTWKPRQERQIGAFRSIRRATARNVRAVITTDPVFHSDEGFEANCEIDNHADTGVAGPNFRVIEATGESADVVPYNDGYEARTDIPIVTTATAWTNPESGETLVLDFNQLLWFGNDMKNSLINPNQLRHFGRSVCDDPTDPNREFGIEIDDQFIPFQMEGTTIYFKTRVPTDKELDECRHVTMTSDEVWDPVTVNIAALRRRSREEEEKSQLCSLGSEPHSEQSTLERGILGSVSEVYDDVEFTKRMIANVNIVTHVRHEDDSVMTIGAIGARNRHSVVTAEEVARKFKCGLDTAKQTLKVTTQRGIRHALHPLHRRYRVDHLDLNRKRLNGVFHMDQLFSNVKSINGNSCANVFTNGKLTQTYPKEGKGTLHMADSLVQLSEDVGIPDTLICDLAPEYVGPKTEFRKEIRRLRINLKNSEQGRHEQNHRAEVEIRELKKAWLQQKREKNIPDKAWDYCLVWLSEVRSRTAKGKNGRPGLEEVLGQTIDISEYLDFEFYDLVWYWDDSDRTMSNEPRKLGRWFGVSHRVGSDMTYWILTEKGKLIARSTVQHVLQTELQKDDVKRQVEEFDRLVNDRMNDPDHVLNEPGVYYLQDEIRDFMGVDSAEQLTPTDEEYGDMILEDKPDVDEDAFDKYLGAELAIDRGGEQIHAKVAKRARADDGTPIGTRHNNPLLDTRVYECVTDEGEFERHTANQIAENIYAQCDTEGLHHLVMKEILDHKKDATAVHISDGYVESRSGNRTPKRTTRGWKLNCEMGDGTTEWIPLKDLKDSNPIELAEYAVANRIQEEPAFKWWVGYVLRKRNRIIGKVKKRYWRTTHKFGIRLPKNVKEALQIDKDTKTDFWWKATQKELKKVLVAFDPNDEWTPEQIRQGLARGDFVGYQEITCHWVFDIKLDLTRKARFVAGGHTTDTPASLTYSSVVTRESVRIAFTIAALNDLDILSCDIGNAYLNAPCREKIWFQAGPEFGSREGCAVKVVRALYGLKTSGASWRNMLAQTIRDMGFLPTRADPDAWRRAATKPNGFEYYEYLLVYVDDILAISHDPKPIMDALAARYELKEDAKEPDRYLGAKIDKFHIPGDESGKAVWSMSAKEYVLEAVRNARQTLAAEGRQLKTNAKTPMPSGYRPELDTTEELSEQQSSMFQQQIGVLRWAIELGRVDIFLEVSVLSQHLALPRVGHLEAVWHMFAYLAKHENSRIAFDPAEPELMDPHVFQEVDWSEIYDPEEVQEVKPPRMVEPRGNSVKISAFVDANHAGNVVTRRSHTGVLVFLQNAPILWYSKRQNTVETSTFGSEFVALRVTRDILVALRYKLRDFGIPIDGPARVFCDNQGVVKNTSLPQSSLSKKHNAVNYHAVREAVAGGVMIVGKEDGETNLADLFTKILTSERRKRLLQCITY